MEAHKKAKVLRVSSIVLASLAAASIVLVVLFSVLKVHDVLFGWLVAGFAAASGILWRQASLAEPAAKESPTTRTHQPNEGPSRPVQ